MSVIWGSGGTSKGGFVKTVLWIVVIYEGLMGVVELASAGGVGGGSLDSIESLPTVGSLVPTTVAPSGTVGYVDLGVAALVYFFALHKK
jgi:hypothetical protein